MDLRRKDFDGIKALATVWKKTPGTELEAGVTRLDITGWQDIIQGLRSIGMREAPQIVKLNITLQNDIRFTLEGAGVIQAFCEDNRISDKPFTAMLKESVNDAQPVDIDYYGVRAKLKRETALANDDVRVKEAINRWPSLIKHYRMIQRFEFAAPANLGIRFDISIVRSGVRNARTFQEGQVTAQTAAYEAEVELIAGRDTMTPEAATSLLIRGMSWMLQGLQRSYVLVSTRGSRAILDSIQGIFKDRSRGFKYPGPQPATLERQNIDAVGEPGVPNLRTMVGGYNVTDKADGLRTLLFVSENGRIFLVDGGGRVYATGIEAEKELAGLVLDGEWIRRDRKGSVVSHYYAFDVLAGKGGDLGVAALPFIGSSSPSSTRHGIISAAITALSNTKQIVKVPVTHALQIGMKSFRTAENVFRDAAAIVLDDAKSAPYVTDGLIFTPNAASLPLGRGTWPSQLKWKPASHNTIDFLVVVEKENGNDMITTKYRDDAGSTVRLKTLRLFVGSRKDAAFADPRLTILGGEPLPTSLDDGEYRAVEFRPSEPRDPMAAICYVAIGEGGSDPAGAAPAATLLDSSDDIMCDSGDVIQSNMIVEMAYYPDRAPGWRWVPMRIRHDKTERLMKGAVGGTMNADWVANSIWSSIHNPITEEMVKTGDIVECVAQPAVYYNRKAHRRDLMKSQCLRNFHNDAVKRDILLRRTLKVGGSLCDFAMGKAGDLHKWVSAGVGYVFGCDYPAANINDPQDGAYARLLSKMVEMGGRDKVAPMVFVQSDATIPLLSAEAGVTPEDKTLIQREFGEGGRGSQGFDVVSCMFALHYMFRDEVTLHGFLTNLADTVKVGGYFVGCGFDGDAVAGLLAKEDSVTGSDGGTDVWTIKKRYGTAIGASVPPSAAGLGLPVDVDFISIGETHTEFLVSWPYLQERLASVGLELLTGEDLTAMGLTASSQMFRETLEGGAKRYDMTDALRRYSFLNRWYIFRRVTDRRPEPLSVTVPVRPPPPPTEVALPSASAKATEVPAIVVSEVIPLGEETVKASSGPLLINPSAEPDDRLGPDTDLRDWARYMNLGTLIPDGITDAFSQGGSQQTIYPSVEAAIAAAKFQVATDKPELGPQIFRVEGALHQKFQREREMLVGNEEGLKKSVDDQVGQTRTLSGKAKIKTFKAAWNQEAWDARKEEVYKTYLAERYRVDERFRRMVLAAKATEKELMLVNGKDYNELGVGLRADGSLAGGDNKVGKWIMGLVD